MKTWDCMGHFAVAAKGWISREGNAMKLYRASNRGLTWKGIMRIPGISALVFWLTIFSAIPPLSASPTVGTNVDITNDGANQNEPMAAINPLNHNRIIVGYNDYRSGVPGVSWSWSDDGGTGWTFGGSFSLTGYNRAGDPVVAFDSTGTAYFAGLAWNRTSSGLVVDGSIFLAKSGDGGHTFNVFRRIVAAGSGTSYYLDKPWLFVNPANNHIYLAWVRRANYGGVGGPETMTIWFTRSTDGGATFSTPI